MSDVKKPGARPTEDAVERLVTDKSTEVRDRAERLGKVLWQHIDLANTDPSMWEAPDDVELDGAVLDVARQTREEKISRYVSSALRFMVPRDFEDLIGTPGWLPNTHVTRLHLNKHDYEIPGDMKQATSDPVSVQLIHIKESPDYPDLADPRQQPYAASYKDGSRLGPQDTEAVISILALMAEKSEYVPSGSA